MGILLWMVVALIVAAALMVSAARRTRKMLPQAIPVDVEAMPGVPVQRLANLALGAVAVLVAGAALLVAWYGPETWWNEDAVRLAVTGLLLAGLVVLLVFNLRVRSLEARDDGSFDERDALILGRSCAGVGGAMMVVTAAWMIALIEGFQPTGLVPSYYLYLLFWSLVMTNVLASLAGIVLAYRRG